MKVLALDIATACGWAVVKDGRVVAAGTARLDADVPTGKRAPPLDVRHVLLVQRLRESVGHLVAAHAPDVVAVEREFGRGAGSRLLVALYTAAQEAALVAELPCLGVRLGDWRKHIHGSAGWSTDRFKAAAVALVPEAAGDADAAEAALIGRYVADKAVVTIGRAA